MKNRNLQDQTLQYYEQNSETFAEGTLTADMDEARKRFLRLLPDQPYVLDFGCGAGRDIKAFLEAGCRVDAADGSEEMCRIAFAYAGIPVRQMRFEDLDAESVYDGIWACASILHLPLAELTTVLHKIARALKPDGLLYTSFKYGNFAGVRNGRFFTDFTEKTLEEMWQEIPELMITKTWITADVRPGREEERWINILARRV